MSDERELDLENPEQNEAPRDGERTLPHGAALSVLVWTPREPEPPAG